MSGVNKVILIGRLGKDPEMRSTSTGRNVCNISLATSENYTKDGNKEERTEWHKIILWEKLADIAGKYLKKGANVYIEGKLQTRNWDKDGQKFYATEIVGQSLQMLGGGGEKSLEDKKDPSYDHSDIPF